LLEIGSGGAERGRYFVRSGFGEVGPPGLTVLAETAIDLVELEADTLNQAIKDGKRHHRCQ
jgi:F-type H+-transporting ATPase subunit epsilon